MSANKLIFEVDGKPSFGKLLIFALQQVLAVLAATILVPTIIGLPVQIPAAILGAGVGTLVYLLFTRFKSPVIISSSFAFLGALSNAIAFGYLGIMLGALFAGLVYVVIAIIVKFVGTEWVNKLMPPVIIGPTVALIGLSLAGNAVADITKSTVAQPNQAYNLVALFCGLVTFFTVVICSVQNKFKTGRLIPFIIGILAGYLVATIFTVIGNVAGIDYLKIIDWSPLTSLFQEIKLQSFLDLPKIALAEGIVEITSGEVNADILAANPHATVLTPIGIAEVALAFIPVAFVTFAEHIADHKNLSSIINKDLLSDPGLSRTLLGDGVGSIAGTVFGICPNTTYGESVGCVAITKNASVRTILAAAIMLVFLSFLAPLTGALRTIPNCVMGGVCLTLYGFIAVSGFKMFQKVDLNKAKNLFIVAAILISGIGGLSIQIPYAIYAEDVMTKAVLEEPEGVFSIIDVVANPAGQVKSAVTITSIAAALILGIITMVICNAVEKRNAPEDDEPVEEAGAESPEKVEE